jgi:hypothetical protein
MPSAVIVSKRGGKFVIPKIYTLRHILVSEQDGGVQHVRAHVNRDCWQSHMEGSLVR